PRPPQGGGAEGEGPPPAVSWAGFEVSGRACVVSCARSPGATTPTPPAPPSSPATRASRAARSERQAVVLFIQRLGECLERLRLALRRHLGGRLGPGKLACFAARRTSPATTAATTAPGREQDHLAADDLRNVTSLLLAIFPGAVLDAPFDVDSVALFHQFLGQISQLSSLVA